MKPGNPKTLIALSVAGAFAAATMLLGQNPVGDANAGSPGKPAPVWQLQTVDGQTIHSSDFKGKVVILDFWATWCGPCRAEIPGFIELQKQYQKQGLAIVGISVDQDGAAAVKKFMQQAGMNYPVVLSDEKIPQAFGGIEAIPTTFVIDRAGNIVKRHLGLDSREEFEKEIRPLLNP